MKTLFIKLESLWGNLFSSINQIEKLIDLSEDDYYEIETARCRSNLQRTMLFCYVVILLETANLFFVFFTRYHTGFKKEYFWTSLLLALVSILYLIVIRLYLTKERNGKIGKAIVLSFWGIYLTGSLLFCYLEIMERSALTNFVLLMASMAIIPVLNWYEMLMYGGIGLLAECGFWYESGLFSLEYIPLCVLLAGMSYLISQALYTSFIAINIAHRQMEKLAETDPLTGLLNRRGFEKRMKGVWEQSEKHGYRVMVSMIDIDFFKSFNDEFGHVEGDKCLIRIAESIGLDFTKPTDLIVRYGGEEFIIFSLDITDDGIIESMNRIAERIEGLHINAGDHTISEYVTVSIGSVSASPSPGLDFLQLYEQADRELTRAKRSGKNVLSFNGVVYGKA